ncbi:putative Ig domain-containing protein, partial [Archangium sp.]|uniref:putative Ig domain-containing protein n=1 Tax=Archangium sp. TaxID=1872627 RepID=UPI002D5550A8
MRRGLPWVGVAVLLGVAACVFQPDFSRFPTCEAQGTCPAGWTCLAQEGVCLPDCGERGPCTAEVPSNTDGGDSDAGTDGGGTGPAQLVLVPDGPGRGTETVSYSHRFQASGGTPPYTFSSPSELPPGLSLNPQGELSGKPASAGEFLFTLEVVDQGATPQHSSQEFALRIRPLLRLAGPGILADVTNGKAYVEQLSATGGKPPYRFAPVTGSTLPAGIVLHENGRVDGTTDEGGVTRVFDARVTDSDEPPQTVTRTLQLTTGSCESLSLCVRTRTLPDARVGTAYAYTLQTSGGTNTATWKLEAGSTLPPGLVLSETGMLSGTPTQASPSPYE